MPELPEVETTRRGLLPAIVGRQVRSVEVREARLRWPVPVELEKLLTGRKLLGIERRAKYLLFRFSHGVLIGHLGMSGSMHLAAPKDELRKHDHVRIRFGRDLELRYHDPRRFGFLLWTDQPPLEHPRLRDLGPEPLEGDFDGRWLASKAKRRRVAVKPFIMNAQVVVGVGNIYASEALFRAGIRPTRGVHRITRAKWELLAEAIREVLAEAVKQGGTTLRDYRNSEGELGYFVQNLRVYERAGEDCLSCGTPIRRLVQAQRATYFCPCCQS